MLCICTHLIKIEDRPSRYHAKAHVNPLTFYP